MADDAHSTPVRAPHPNTMHNVARPRVSAARRAYLSEIMHAAWSKFRFELGRVTFADALRHAWSWAKGATARAATTARWEATPRHRVIALRAAGQSPVRRSLSGKAYANREAWDAGHLTTRLGA